MSFKIIPEVSLSPFNNFMVAVRISSFVSPTLATEQLSEKTSKHPRRSSTTANQKNIPAKSSSSISNVCGYLAMSMSGDVDNANSSCFVSIGNVASSRDGEVRAFTVDRKVFNTIMDSELWETIEDPFVKYMGNALLDSLFYFPATATDDEKDSFKKWFFDARYDFKIAMAHFYIIIDIFINRGASKFSPISLNWIRPDMDILVAINREVESKFGQHALEKAIRKVSGQIRAMKIIPITVNELRYVNDIRYRVWRECYAQKMCREVRTVRISYQFTLYDNWAMVHNIDEDMFMNPFVLARFRRSDVVREINRTLARLERDVLPDGQVDPNITTQADPYQEEFATTVQFATNNVILSNVAIVNLSTVVTQPLDGKSFTDDEMKDLLFDWMYALLVMHTHMGLIHADTHIGNLRMLHSVVNAGIIIGTDIYIPRTPTRGHIIDFSRTIANPFFAPLQHNTSASPEVIAHEQERYLLDFFLFNFPEYQQIKIVEDMIRDDYDRAFHILSILDPIFLITSVRKIVSGASRSTDFIDHILARCNVFLTKALDDPSKIDITSYPILSILTTEFGMEKRDDVHHADRKDNVIFNHTPAYPNSSIGDEYAELLSMPRSGMARLGSLEATSSTSRQATLWHGKK